MEKTKAEKLAFTVNYVADNHAPGLLPEDLRKAAALLIEQEGELNTLRGALAAKDHVVEAEAEEVGYFRKRIRGTFIVTSPRIYYGEIEMDDQFIARDPDYALHVARRLTSVATADCIRELQERAYIAIRKAIAAGADRPRHEVGSGRQPARA